ncbi:MAG: orotate phosphoribosyltransferase [Phycisphaerales bacterium]|nr:orotate phosphoribosyltransferase [Phycisphaerales bacterium]
MSTDFDPKAARGRLLTLVRERAYKSGVDIVLASGKRSDFYINGKFISLHPEGLYLMSMLMLEQLRELPGVTAVGGLTLGADPIAAGICALSHRTGQSIDAFLVRKEPKGHGTASQIEGTLEAGQKVVVIEDTITTGGSARKAIDVVRAVGADPVAVFALADRMDPEGDAFRREFDVRPLFTIEEIRNG